MSCKEHPKSAAVQVSDLPPPGLMNLQLRELSVTLQAKPPRESLQKVINLFRSKYPNQKSHHKTILNNLSADIRSGTLTAIVGSSGCGKTTLLSVMSGRIVDKSLQVTGEITFRGQPLGILARRGSRLAIPYVVQDDILLPCLTVEETLEYAAALRLPDATHQERSERVRKVIIDLGLEGCARSPVGDKMDKGCSGGEKRRTSVAIQLLTDSPLLFLDEPTTGLDAASALQMVRILNSLARQGRTVIMTIHQPRSDIWPLIDNLIVLSRGHTIFSGPSGRCLPHLERVGYPIPKFVNPFEFILDVASQRTRLTRDGDDPLHRVNALKQAWSDYNNATIKDVIRVKEQLCEPTEGPVKVISTPGQNWLSPMLRHSWTQTRRTWLVTMRDRIGASCSVFEAVIMGLITGCIFYRVGKDLPGIRSREGAMHTAAGLQSYLILIFETYRLSNDIQIFDRERNEGVSAPLAFLVSRRLSRVFLEDIPVPLIYSTIFYFMAGFRHEADVFFIFFAVVYLMHVMAVSVAVLCVALNRNFLLASLTANTIFVMQSMAAGFFVNLADVSPWLQWMKWISYLFYAFSALCYNEFSGQFYDCPVSSASPNTTVCAPYSGKAILESLDIPAEWLWRPIMVLVAFIVVTWGLSLIILHLTHNQTKMTPKLNHEDLEIPDFNLQVELGRTKRRIRVALHGLSLRHTSRRLWSGGRIHRDLLVNVSAQFESAQLHVIMGPSGSGKTTLLDLMARGLESKSNERRIISGTITFNNYTISPSVLQSSSAYVPQENEIMLSTLTVRETLRYAARMRLPQHISRDEQHRRVEQLMNSLGLADCADTMVGDAYTKGISGGEKKRLTIATYVLADPAVLFLDEPTSGLDSATASSIINMLENLSKEGRTIIMSIHQPRSEWLGKFGTTLLLRQGGHVMYSGETASMLEHVRALGFECPSRQNPADFFLDVTMQHLSDPQSEQATVLPRTESLSRDTEGQSTLTVVNSQRGGFEHAAELGQFQRHTLGFRAALPLLLHRGILHLKRQRIIAFGRILQIIGLGMVLTCFFTPLKHGSASIQSRIGYVQQLGSLFFVGMLNSISIFPTERDLFFREKRDGLYRVEAFLTAYTILEVPSQVLGALLFSILTVLAVGFPRTIHLFMVVALNAICVVSCGKSLGIALLSIVSHTGLAVTVCCIVMSVFVHITGIIAISMPLFLLRDITFTCGDAERLPSGKCPIERGAQVLDLYNLNVDAGRYLWILVALTFGYRLVAYVVLKIKMGSPMQ